MANRTLIALVAAAVTLTPAVAAQRDTPEMKLDKALAGRVAGEPVNCINLFGSNSSEIIEGKAIIFRVGSTIYVNTPRSGASTLDDDDILLTRTISSQLCSSDSVRLIDRVAKAPTGFVILDKFVPYTKPKNTR